VSGALGARVTGKSTSFAVRAPKASAVWLCLFRGHEEERHKMRRRGDVWRCRVQGNLAGAHYGFRAEGEWDPERGLWFDPAKLLVDPYAVEFDRRLHYDPALAGYGGERAQGGGAGADAQVAQTAAAVRARRVDLRAERQGLHPASSQGA
jgi:glycogen operon protein